MSVNPSGQELSAIDQWIYQTLTGDATLMALIGGVHEHPAPQTMPFPIITYQDQGDFLDVPNTNAVQPIRVVSRGTYLVRVIGKEVPTSALRPIAARIDQLLEGKHGATALGTIAGCSRVRPYKFQEFTDGINYRHLGGMYRITVR